MKALKAKNPTRLIPDIPGKITLYIFKILASKNLFLGFFCLTKNEIKQDSKDIHKISLSSMVKDCHYYRVCLLTKSILSSS
jgi:hypothetical protein